MSNATKVAPAVSNNAASSSEPDRVPSAVDFHYTQTDSFVNLLEQLGASLLVSTYQANKLLAVRAADGGLSTLVRTFERPMGIAADARRLALGTRSQIWQLRDAPDIAPRIDPAAPGRHDACYLPRNCHVTGDIGVHEIAWAEDQKSVLKNQRQDQMSGDLAPDLFAVETFPGLWLVSTRFSCLCTLHPDYSFVPRWRPPFVTAVAAEDRCHLNGLAMRNGHPKYVTALAETDTPDGWRPLKAHSGCLIDVPSGEIVARGLSMPHSPRWHDGRLWLLESGTGEVVLVDPATGTRQSVMKLPGFTRGLALCGDYAFVGLSKIRKSSAMDGVPLAERRHELKCGVAALDLHRGQLVGLLEFQTAVEEVFDVQLLPGIRFPEIIGFQKDTLHHTFVVPTEATLNALPRLFAPIPLIKRKEH
jgi:uncharacterized protein (TIGR03032 family)